MKIFYMNDREFKKHYREQFEKNTFGATIDGNSKTNVN